MNLEELYENKYFKNYQEELKKLYLKVADILDESNIRFWAHSGTLLGVKRHNGELIPWDDDIDIMVQFKEWKENNESLKEKVSNENLIIHDEILDGVDKRVPLKICKIFSNVKIRVNDTGDDDVDFATPFIDIFFAVPSKSKKTEFGWFWYESMYKTMWIWQKGFNRYSKNQDKIFKPFLINLITYPLKLIFWRRLMQRYIFKPFEKKEGWNSVRRLDFWTHRKIIYDLNDGMIEGEFLGRKILYSKDWENELIESFGPNWKNEVYKEPHIFNEWRINTKAHKKYKKD